MMTTVAGPCDDLTVDEVMRRLRACEVRWSLEDARGLDGGCRADVFAGEGADGGVVVKLVNPPGRARAEAAALAAWARTRAAVRLIDADFAVGALLLERVLPGTPLPEGDEHEAVHVASDLLTRLHRATPGQFRFTTLAEGYTAHEAQALADVAFERRVRAEPARGEAGLSRLAAARAAAMALCADTDRPVLLHGDFADKNILRTGEGHLAIDPSPRLGDPHADVGFFAACHPPARGILRRADAIAERMGLDGHRARRWAAVWTVHQSCQAWREDQGELDAVVRGGGLDGLL